MTHHDPTDPTARVSSHEVDVPGSPEEVWRAVATGPGIGTWFVPAQVEEREGGRIVTDHGPYGKSEGVVTVWEPPHRFAYEEAGWNPARGDAPPWATELRVEGRDGGVCRVRLVSGFFTGGEGWEEHLDSTHEGWEAALRNLRLSLTHFPAGTAASMTATGTVGHRTPDDVARELFAALGLAGVGLDAPVRAPGDAPALSGSVVHADPRAVTVRTAEPWPGLVEFGVFGFNGATVAVRGHLFGGDAGPVAEREGPRWTAWLAAHVAGFTPLT